MGCGDYLAFLSLATFLKRSRMASRAPGESAFFLMTSSSSVSAHRVVLHQGRLGAESVAEAQVTARVEHQVVGEHHVRGAVEDAHDAELLAVLFHVAEAQAVGAGRPSRDFVHSAVGASNVEAPGVRLRKLRSKPPWYIRACRIWAG